MSYSNEEKNKVPYYRQVHEWIYYHYGKASKCSNKKCKWRNPKRYEWALIKGKEYEKNIRNFKQLCPSCHRKYDYTEDKRQRMIQSKTGLTYNNKSIDQFSLEGVFIKTHESIKLAAREVGISDNAISNHLYNRTKKAGGYKWSLNK